MEYTVAFVFNQDLSKILLLNPTSPEWQVGKLNGLGGKFESDESVFECAKREVYEESGLETSLEDWVYIAKEFWPDLGDNIHFLAYVHNQPETNFESSVEGELEWVLVNNLPERVISNLKWQIPLAVDFIKRGKIKKEIVIECKGNY